ncbi:hypothetical protein EX30DRAFT_338299 [Ascodesmis nigricans]|uniref:Serine hydrolase domain-containing protein n=1 Tax=Ascodesmis nigricans TaxID=341454 RepID=A0A4V3SJE5_9PEZI|nr:hypothetical protein EX30DRAFT_338299 [Ascodesmis nigricans]
MSILFLHGYSQSGPLFSAKTKALQKPLLKSLTTSPAPPPHFLFPTAPHRLLLSDLPGTGTSTPSAPADYSPTSITNAADELAAAQAADADLDAYGWWRRDMATGAARGLEKTWEWLKEYLLQHGPITGIIGFSQGAALAAMLASALESPETAPKELGVEELHRKNGQGKVKFVVAYSGFRVVGQDWAYPEGGIKTTFLNVIGSLDTVVDEGRTRKLVEAVSEESGKVAVHPGGHFVPAGKQWVGVLVGFVGDALRQENGVNGVKEKEEEDAADMDVPF